MIRDNYKNGECPDCSEPIPFDILEGEECFNCGYIFYESGPNDDGWLEFYATHPDFDMDHDYSMNY